MKKVLLSATALSLLAGAAVADVKVSGSARMGLKFQENADLNPSKAGAQEFGIEKRMTINMDASTETDGGVALGGRIRVRSDEYTGTGLSGANVYASAGGFKVTVGNINGAIEVMPGLYNNNLGLTGLSWSTLATNTSTGAFNWDSFSSTGNGAEGVAASYSAAGFTINASYGSTSDNAAVSASYAFGDWTVALGYQAGGVAADDKIVGIVSGSFGPAGVTFQAADNDGNLKLVLSGNYDLGATKLEAYVATEDAGGESFGIGAEYGLGGGATIAGAIEQQTSGDLRGDLGVKFNF